MGFIISPFFWGGVILILVSYWLGFNENPFGLRYVTLIVLYGIIYSVEIFDIRLHQERKYNGRDVGSLPSWTVLFGFAALALGSALILLNWKAFLVLFAVRFILKLLPVLETIGGILMTPFFTPPARNSDE